jgi:hypothetical protein
LRVQLGDAIDLHDSGTMNAGDAIRIELGFERCQRLAEKVLALLHVQADVIVGRFQPVDRVKSTSTIRSPVRSGTRER